MIRVQTSENNTGEGIFLSFSVLVSEGKVPPSTKESPIAERLED